MAKAFPITKRVGFIAGIVCFITVLLWPSPVGMTPEGQKAAAVAVIMAIWWMTECLPVPATALLPLVLFPTLGIMSMKQVSTCFGDPNILLFTGGFFIAVAMQKWGLHRRIALRIIAIMGVRPRQMVLGFMIATAFLSMWISNTATTMMMLPIAISIIGQLQGIASEEDGARFGQCLMLSIAYAASIGGIGTLIGTPPNIVLAAQMRSLFPEAPEIGFLQWMKVGIPLVVVFLPLTWLLLTSVFFRMGKGTFEETNLSLDEELKKLGKMNRGEKIVLVVFVLTALAWIFRKDLNLGFVTIPGWSNLFPKPEMLHDGMVAIFFALVLFMAPVNLKKGEFALDWESALKIPWGILLLFGGGLAIALGFKETGLIGWGGNQLQLLSGVTPIIMVLAIALLMTFLTEITSNTATTTIMLPILAVTGAQVLHVNPLLLMVPATISASCAFMLPVATPPNAIIFGSGQITIPQMARTGVALNFLGVALVTLLTYTLAVPVFGIVFGEAPLWAQ